MEQSIKFIKTLEEFYGNGHIGLASQVGYMSGMLKSLEMDVKGVGKCIQEHTDWLKQNRINKK